MDPPSLTELLALGSPFARPSVASGVLGRMEMCENSWCESRLGMESCVQDNSPKTERYHTYHFLRIQPKKNFNLSILYFSLISHVQTCRLVKILWLGNENGDNEM